MTHLQSYAKVDNKTKLEKLRTVLRTKLNNKAKERFLNSLVRLLNCWHRS